VRIANRKVEKTLREWGGGKGKKKKTVWCVAKRQQRVKEGEGKQISIGGSKERERGGE